MTDQHPLSIGDLATKYGCSLRTLRFYEEKGFLAPLRIGERRLYSERDEIKLQLVLRGKRLGLSLEEVQALILAKCEEAAFNDPRTQAVASLLPKEKIIDQITLLTERRAGLETAIAELKGAEARIARM